MIGIIGGYGDIGRYVFSVLADKYQNIKIGGRNPQNISDAVRMQLSGAEFEQVDIREDNSLKRFIKNCRIIINCSGPSHETSFHVYKIVKESGIPYVDVGFDMRFLEESKKETESSAVYGCGSSPGLSGILQKYLINQFDEALEMAYYYGGLSPFSHASAEDYLIGACEEKTGFMAEWRCGKKEPFVSAEQEEVWLPYFPQKVKIIPFFDDECEEVAQNTKIQNARWYMAADGVNVEKLLQNARYQWRKNRQKLIYSLCTSADLDLINRKSYMCFFMKCKGILTQKNVTKNLVLKIENPSQLTGTVAGITADALLQNQISKGLHALAACMSPAYMINRLRDLNIMDVFKIYDTDDTDIYDDFAMEEGEI